MAVSGLAINRAGPVRLGKVLLCLAAGFSVSSAHPLSVHTYVGGFQCSMLNEYCYVHGLYKGAHSSEIIGMCRFVPLVPQYWRASLRCIQIRRVIHHLLQKKQREIDSRYRLLAEWGLIMTNGMHLQQTRLEVRELGVKTPLQPYRLVPLCFPFL